MTARRTLTPAPDNRSEKELRDRLAYLDGCRATAAGALLPPAWDEERREIKGALARLTHSSVVSDPTRAAAIAELHRAQASIDRAREHLMGPTELKLTAEQIEEFKAEWRKLHGGPPLGLSLPSVRTARKWPWQREFWR